MTEVIRIEDLGKVKRQHPRATGKRKQPGTMNKLEAAYAAELDRRVKSGEVVKWWYESFRVRLADKTWYTPDFAVILADGAVEYHEVKGFWEEDARVKIKVFAEQYPFVVRAITSVKGLWHEEVWNV